MMKRSYSAPAILKSTLSAQSVAWFDGANEKQRQGNWASNGIRVPIPEFYLQPETLELASSFTAGVTAMASGLIDERY